MLDCIRQELQKTKANIEALKQSEIANQKAKANIEVIEPEMTRLETEKQKGLNTAKAAYDKQVSEIINSYDLQKAAFKDRANEKIQAKVEESFKAVITEIDKQLADE
jgi:hypothetical protein